MTVKHTTEIKCDECGKDLSTVEVPGFAPTRLVLKEEDHPTHTDYRTTMGWPRPYDFCCMRCVHTWTGKHYGHDSLPLPQ